MLINGLTALKPRTGIGQYTARLAAELANLMPPGQLLLYPPAPYDRLAWRLLHACRGGACAPAAANGEGWQAAVRQWAKAFGRGVAARHFAHFARTRHATIYHEPNYIPFSTNIPTVITIHDLSVLLHPEWHPAERVREHARKLRQAVAQAAHILADSHQVRQEIMQELGVPSNRVTAVHLAAGREFHRCEPAVVNHWQQALDLPKRFLLCVGTIEPRKNLLIVMRAFRQLPPHLRTHCPLLLVGPWGWRSEAEQEFYRAQGRAAGIRHMGYLPDAAMPALYTAAAALLYPSLYEGFGLPPLEAAACGCPAICSRGTAAVAEVMQDAATYCHPHDLDGWRQAMIQAAEHRAAPVSTRSLGTFTWQQTAGKTLAVYERVLGMNPVSAWAA